MVFLADENGNYGDLDLSHLITFLEILDPKIIEISSKIEKSIDPVSDGLCDLGEHLIGIGFVAIQRYMHSTYSFLNITKKSAFEKSPKIDNDVSFFAVVNAAANHWKHQEEIYSSERTQNQEKYEEERLKTLFTFDPNLVGYYPLSEILFKTLKQIDNNTYFSFLPLLPLIKQWRNELHKK
jgi:hypothetical protein